MKALGKSTQYLQTLNVPEFKTNLEDSGLEYGNLLNCDNKQLEEYLLVYGGFKAYLEGQVSDACLLYTSPSPRDGLLSRMPSSA